MAESRFSRVLDMSDFTENNEQQYVEVGSNIFLGTKDGMKYSLMQTGDNKLRLVENPSVSSLSVNDPDESFEALQCYESSNVSSKESELLSESKEREIISKPSPCKGQGDEIGNIVLSPRNFSSGFTKSESTTEEKVKQELTPEYLNTSSVLTYTTLYPKQNKEELVTYFVTPRSSYSNYSPVFSSPVTVRPPRYTRRARMPFMPHDTPCTPILRIRRGGTRMRRPRQPVYQYTPQILHSTPTTSAHASYNSDSFSPLSGSSGSFSGSSLSKSDSSLEYPRVPHNTPTSEELSNSKNQKVFSVQWMPYIENFVSVNPREIHNEKERHRRLRIKNACLFMRSFLPWISEKTDNATVFEEVVNFIDFVKGMVECKHDIEFMEQNYYTN